MNAETYRLCGEELSHHRPGPTIQDTIDPTNCVIHISQIIIEIRCCVPKEVGLWNLDTLRVFRIRFAVISMKAALVFPVIRPVQDQFLNVLDRSSIHVVPVIDGIVFGSIKQSTATLLREFGELTYWFLNQSPTSNSIQAV